MAEAGQGWSLSHVEYPLHAISSRKMPGQLMEAVVMEPNLVCSQGPEGRCLGGSSCIHHAVWAGYRGGGVATLSGCVPGVWVVGPYLLLLSRKGGRVGPLSHFPDPCRSPSFLEWLLGPGELAGPCAESRWEKPALAFTFQRQH